MKHSDTLVIIPTLNEARSLESSQQYRDRPPQKLVEACLQFADVVLVDKDSTDGTPDIARRQGACVLRQGNNDGLRGAYHTGYWYALEQGYDHVLTLDAESHDPYLIPEFRELSASGNYDMIVGSRLMRGSRFIARPQRKLLTKLSSYAVHWATGQERNDVTSGARYWRADALRVFLGKAWPRLEARGHAVQVEQTTWARGIGLRVGFLAMTYLGGRSSLNRKRLIEAWESLWRLRRQLKDLASTK